MSISFCGFSFNQQSLPKIIIWEGKCRDIARGSTATAIFGGATALTAKVWGWFISLISQGQYTTLGSLFFSSPYFLVPFKLVVATAVISSLATQICSHIRDQINRKGLQEGQDHLGMGGHLPGIVNVRGV